MSSPAEQPSTRRQQLGCGCFFSIVLLICAVFFGRAVWNAREAARAASCISQLKMTGLGMLNYASVHGHYLPAYTADERGRPMHSWRMLLMPQQCAEALYEQYDLSEPWNSQHNLALAPRVPSGMGSHPNTYHCPSDRDTSIWHTSQVMLVGPEAVSNGPTSRQPDGIPDGTSYTIMVAEMSDSGIHWMEPRDLKVGEMSFKINDNVRKGIRSQHHGVANAMFADGSVRRLSEDIDPKVLRGLTTIAGGEDISAVSDY